MYEVIEKPNSLDPSIIMRVCHSTKDGGYIGTEDVAKMLCDERGIQPELIPGSRVCSIGFCEKEQKWYGWSHRALYGFGVGSAVSKGDCAYTPTTPEELIEEHANWLDWDFSEDTIKRHGREAIEKHNAKTQTERRAECQILPDRTGIRILHSPMIIPVVEMSDLAEAIDGCDVPTDAVDLGSGYSIIECGRGEWTAQTLDDAKQMAIDFADGVS